MGTDNYYSVKEDVQKYIDGCKTKMNVRTHKVFGRAILAGMMIAFGASASNVAPPEMAFMVLNNFSFRTYVHISIL